MLNTYGGLQSALTRGCTLLLSKGEPAREHEECEEHGHDCDREPGTEESGTDGGDTVVGGGHRDSGALCTEKRSTSAIGGLPAGVAPLQSRVHGGRLHRGNKGGERHVLGVLPSRQGHAVGPEGVVISTVLEVEAHGGFGAVRGLADFESKCSSIVN